MRAVQFLLGVGLFCFVAPVTASPSWAQSPELPSIRFDVPATIACQEVTDESFAQTHSLEKLLEVRITTSSLLESGSDRLIRELFFFIYSPDRSIRIVDLAPKTTLITEYASPIDESENRENSNSAGFNFTPNLEMTGKANINATLSDRVGKTRRTALLPPKQLAIASGTQNRTTAAYFKLKPSSQETLEGTQELVLFIKVPIAWRADLLHIHCRGKTGRPGGKSTRVSRADFIVPIHAASDAPARLSSEKLVQAESRLRHLAAGFQPPAIRKSKKLTDRVTLFVKQEILGKSPPPAPDPNWLGKVIFTRQSVASIEESSGIDLSPEVETAVQEYRSARQKLLALNH